MLNGCSLRFLKSKLKWRKLCDGLSLLPIIRLSTYYHLWPVLFNYKNYPYLTENVIICSYQGTPRLWLGWRVGKYRVSKPRSNLNSTNLKVGFWRMILLSYAGQRWTASRQGIWTSPELRHCIMLTGTRLKRISLSLSYRFSISSVNPEPRMASDLPSSLLFDLLHKGALQSRCLRTKPAVHHLFWHNKNKRC